MQFPAIDILTVSYVLNSLLLINVQRFLYDNRKVNAVFSKIAAIRLLQSDCIAMGLNDDLAEVYSLVYSEESVKSPVTYSLLLVMRNGD